MITMVFVATRNSSEQTYMEIDTTKISTLTIPTTPPCQLDGSSSSIGGNGVCPDARFPQNGTDGCTKSTTTHQRQETHITTSLSFSDVMNQITQETRSSISPSGISMGNLKNSGMIKLSQGSTPSGTERMHKRNVMIKLKALSNSVLRLPMDQRKALA